MITGSTLLALVAVVFLAVGLVRGQEEFYYCSIVASVLAGLALFAGLRHRPAAQLPDDDFDVVRPAQRHRGRRAPVVGRASLPRPTRPSGGTTYESAAFRAVDAGTGAEADPRTSVNVSEDPQIAP